MVQARSLGHGGRVPCEQSRDPTAVSAFSQSTHRPIKLRGDSAVYRPGSHTYRHRGCSGSNAMSAGVSSAHMNIAFVLAVVAIYSLAFAVMRRPWLPWAICACVCAAGVGAILFSG